MSTFTILFFPVSILVIFLIAFLVGSFLRWPIPTAAGIVLFLVFVLSVSQYQLDEVVQHHNPTCVASETATIIQHVKNDVAVSVSREQAATISLGQPLPDKPQPGNTYYTIDNSDPLGLKTSYITEETCTWKTIFQETSYTIKRVHHKE